MRTIITIILLCLCTVASAQIYTWRDASGKVHYSDTPPTDANAKKIDSGVPASNDSPAANNPGRSLAEQEAAFRKRQAEAEKARAKSEQDKKDLAERQRNCQDARAQLDALESGRRIGRINAQGEAIPLDDEMRAQEIERGKKAVESWCK